MSSYHVHFLGSHEGHPDNLNANETPVKSTNLKSIVQSTIPTPIFFDKDEEEYLPLEDQPQDAPALQEPIVTPETIPHHSTSIAEKHLDPKPSRLDNTIKECGETATRVKTACTEKKKMLQDLHEEESRNTPNIIKYAAIKELCQAFRTLNLREEKREQIDQVLSSISEMTKIDPSILEFEDEPKTWEEAKQSADAK